MQQHQRPWAFVQRKLRAKRKAADKARGFKERTNSGARCQSYREQWEERGQPEGDFTAWLRKEGLI